MGQVQILEKLNNELSRDICEESQVVYIFSRIRKYLEINDLKKKYKYLNFYCNWALHSSIENTKQVQDILKEFIDQQINSNFLIFTPLLKELKEFLTEFSLPQIILEKKNNTKLIKILLEIYSDTPVEIYCDVKRIITLQKPLQEHPNSIYSIAYKIE